MLSLCSIFDTEVVSSFEFGFVDLADETVLMGMGAVDATVSSNGIAWTGGTGSGILYQVHEAGRRARSILC